LADQILADFTPLQVTDIPAYVVRPAAQRELYTQAPRYSVSGGSHAARNLRDRVSEAWRIRQERAAIRHISELGQQSATYDAVSVVRYQASVRPERARPARGMVLACSVVAGLLPVGWAVTAHLAAPPVSHEAMSPASALIAAQNVSDKLPEIAREAKGGQLEQGRRLADMTYVAQAGDTFSSIGARFGLTGRTVRLVNELPLGYRLHAGEKLTVPPMNGAYHRVHAGENVGEIASRYEVTQATILAANPGLKADHLALNQRVFIPGAKALKYPEAPVEERGGRRGVLGPWGQRLASSRSLVGMFGARVGNLLQPTIGQFSSPFGVRGASFHPGMDICNAVGTPIHAAKAGVVISAGWNGAYGNAVDIDHGGGVVTRYGHCSRVLVHAGQTVEAGEVIAKMGSTGRSTGPHLHFEVRIQDRAVNPANFL
jgi:murein DD-endopeptidase MepM/ murein hydrolase activator NlpD